jgi:uncharacterized membrane protein YfcA
MDPLTIAFGLITGVLIGLTGMGGGAIMGPILIMGLGVPPVTAVGVDLVYSAATKVAGSAVHWRRGTVDMRLVGLLCLGSVPGSLGGVALLAAVRARGHDPNVLVTKALGVALVLAALAIGARLLAVRRKAPPSLDLGRWFTVASGAAVGFLVGLSSVGSGTLLVALLSLTTGMAAGRIVGTDLVHGAILAGAAGAVHAGLGHVDLPLTLNILVGSIPGVILGARLSVWSPEWLLRPVLALVLLTAGLRLIG